MNAISSAILRSGIIPSNQVREFTHWHVPLPSVEGETSLDVKDLATIIEQELQKEGFVLTRTTNLEALKEYLSTEEQGTLHLVGPEGEEGEFPVFVGHTRLGEYILPWRGESIYELIANRQTNLRVGEKTVYFRDVRELFYGEHKAFMVCIPLEEG